MTKLTHPDDFNTLLHFAVGIADRGIPMSLVLLEPTGWSGVEVSVDQAKALDALGGDLVRGTRRGDRVTRITPSRFAVLLVDCNRQGAVVFADRMNDVSKAFSEGTGAGMSCGIASWSEGMQDHRRLVAGATQALERAHGAGGGIELHEP